MEAFDSVLSSGAEEDLRALGIPLLAALVALGACCGGWLWCWCRGGCFRGRKRRNARPRPRPAKKGMARVSTQRHDDDDDDDFDDDDDDDVDDDDDFDVDDVVVDDFDDDYYDDLFEEKEEKEEEEMEEEERRPTRKAPSSKAPSSKASKPDSKSPRTVDVRVYVGKYGGKLGIKLDEAKGAAKIRALQPGGAAEAAGLRIGDEVAKIDGAKVAGGAGAADEASRMIADGNDKAERVFAVRR